MRILVICALLTIGCATIPPTSGTIAIDNILTDGTIDAIPSAQKDKIKSALTQARADIVRSETRRINAEEDARSNATWAGAAKGAAACAGVILIMGIILLVRKIL